MSETLSIIIPTRGLDVVPSVPPGADEVILIGGNDGIAHAKNLGFQKATGSILVFADDDVALEGDLESLKRAPPEDAWWTGTYRDATGDPYSQRMAAGVNVAARLGMHAASIGPFLGIRRSLFLRAGGFPENAVHEDTTLSRTLGQLGARLVLAPITVTLHRPFTPYRGMWERAGRHRGRAKAPDAPFRRLVPATPRAPGR